jgi:hypothetical protein
MFSFRMRSIFLLTHLLLSTALLAQGLTGIWRGYFITDQFEQYKFEIQIEQNGPLVQGVSYSYLNTTFYGKAALKGNAESGAKRLHLEETQTIELKMSDGSYSCIMDCDLVWARSGREEFLEGTYTSKFEKSAPGVRKGSDCGDGKVFLRRVTESDFYLEPFLKNQAKNNKPIYENQAPPNRTKTTPSFAKTQQPSQPNTGNPAPEKINPAPITLTPFAPSKPKKDYPLPEVLTKRINDLTRELNVTDRSVRVRLYDNGEIDGDTITVYVGNRLILSQKRLTAVPLEFQFEIPEDEDVQEVTMVAENLGSIPPNTSLMIVEAGQQRFEVRITSTEQKNAVVRFRHRSNQ